MLLAQWEFIARPYWLTFHWFQKWATSQSNLCIHKYRCHVSNNSDFTAWWFPLKICNYSQVCVGHAWVHSNWMWGGEGLGERVGEAGFWISRSHCILRSRDLTPLGSASQNIPSKYIQTEWGCEFMPPGEDVWSKCKISSKILFWKSLWYSTMQCKLVECKEIATLQIAAKTSKSFFWMYTLHLTPEQERGWASKWARF
jgi:hypothetical protein